MKLIMIFYKIQKERDINRLFISSSISPRFSYFFAITVDLNGDNKMQIKNIEDVL